MDAKAKAKAALLELASSHLRRALRSLESGDVNGICEAEIQEALDAVRFAVNLGVAK